MSQPLFSRLFGPRASGRQGQAAAQGPPPRPRRLPTPGQLRRERRALLRAREERIRDLGGLMLEMYKRDQFSSDLVAEQCAELVGLEERVEEIEAMLAAAAVARRPIGRGTRCLCGAPLLWGSHFCANCGRPVGAAPVVACVRCSHPLPADAKFCGNCGMPVDAAAARSAQEPRDARPQAVQPPGSQGA